MDPITRPLPHQRQGLLGFGVWLLLLCLLAPAEAQPAPLTITVLSERDDGAYGEALTAFAATLAVPGAGEAPTLKRLIVPEEDPLPRDRLGPGETGLVVTLGTRMAERVLASRLRVPLLAALIPMSAYEAALQKSDVVPPPQVSALYLDQPWRRQLQLIRLAFPDARHVAVAFGPTSRAQEPALKAAAEGLSLTLQTTELSTDEAPLKALRRILLDNDDVLLAIPDPAVYNPYSVQGILLDTYRRRIPLMGFSKAYVTAGATLAIYTSPAQVGEEAAALILNALDGSGLELPAARHPHAFTVSVNRQVARSLGISLPDASELERRLQALETTP